VVILDIVIYYINLIIITKKDIFKKTIVKKKYKTLKIWLIIKSLIEKIII